MIKRRLYAQAGIRCDWLIDPDLRAFFDAIELDVGRLLLPKEADSE